MKGTTFRPVTILLTVAVLLFLSVELPGVIYYNDSDIGFENLGGNSSVLSVAPLSGYVIKGAGYFLQSYSDYLLFLNKVEVSSVEGFSYDDLYTSIDATIMNLEQARELYIQLKAKTDTRPYNSPIIKELADFNYRSLQKKLLLLEPILDEVKSYLIKGDIRGLYNKALKDTEKLLAATYTIRDIIATNTFPVTNDLLDIDETYAQSLRFGQYTARIFKEIK